MNKLDFFIEELKIKYIKNPKKSISYFFFQKRIKIEKKKHFKLNFFSHVEKMN